MIKRISLNVFLRLKELVDSVKVITPRGNRKKSNLAHREPDIVMRHYEHEYESSNIINTSDGPLRQWRRVIQWDKYLNDPVDNRKGHSIIE